MDSYRIRSTVIAILLAVSVLGVSIFTQPFISDMRSGEQLPVDVTLREAELSLLLVIPNAGCAGSVSVGVDYLSVNEESIFLRWLYEPVVSQEICGLTMSVIVESNRVWLYDITYTINNQQGHRGGVMETSQSGDVIVNRYNVVDTDDSLNVLMDQFYLEFSMNN